MLQERDFEKRIWRARWPIIVGVVASALVIVQIIRVNQPVQHNKEEIVSPIKYTERGPLLNGYVPIAANEFFSTRIEVNRRAKLSGMFRMPSIKSRVGVLVLSEASFENWKSGQSYQPVAETGIIPGGKINAGLEPGVYFLVIDNRHNGSEQSVYADFSLD